MANELKNIMNSGELPEYFKETEVTVLSKTKKKYESLDNTRIIALSS